MRSICVSVDEAIRMVRKVASDLRPPVLDDLGLAAAIEWQTSEFQHRTGLACRFECDPPELELDRARSTALFRICQELLTNVTRHARAKSILVRLEALDGEVVLTVADDGRGIREEQMRAPGSFGIVGMRERALAFGGRVEIVGAPGAGTTARVIVPLG